MAVPANVRFGFVFQDIQGFKARTEMNYFIADISAGAMSQIMLGSMQVIGSGIATAIAAASNAKIVEQSFSVSYSYAQEPSSETGNYQLVRQKATLHWGDGNGGFQKFELPAPVNGLFETTSQDDLIVVKPGTTLLNNIQSALAGTNSQGAFTAGVVGPILTPRGGSYGSQFFGGQLVNAKPPRRRVLQGA